MAKSKGARAQLPNGNGTAPKVRKRVRFHRRAPLVHSDEEGDNNHDGGVQLNRSREAVLNPIIETPDEEGAASSSHDDDDDDDDGQDSDDGGVSLVAIKPLVISTLATPYAGSPAGFKLDPTTSGFAPTEQNYAPQTGHQVIQGPGHQQIPAYQQAPTGHRAPIQQQASAPQTSGTSGFQGRSKHPVPGGYTNGNGYGQAYKRQNGPQTHGTNDPVHGQGRGVKPPTNGGQGGYNDRPDGGLQADDGHGGTSHGGTPHGRGIQPGTQAGMKSEPHNFAPRLTSPIICEPPPRFLLAAPSPSVGGQVVQQGPVAAGALVPYNADPFNVAQQQQVVPLQPSLAMAPHGAEPVPHHIKVLRSAHLNRITDGPTGRPTLNVALNPANFPFIQSTTQAEAVNYGVIKIKNIPFTTQRAEIVAFLGRNSMILNDNQEPVHIIMERVTSKTHDAYVEFVTLHDAMKAVEKHSRGPGKGKPSRLGDRPVEVELSSQAMLMKDLFPLAAGIFWDGSKPNIKPSTEGEPWNDFKGFITEEEMTMLVKHVEIPQRSPFSRECPQRPFECMISTIKKLPWYMAEHITIRQRHAVYKAAVNLIRLLQLAIKDRRNEGVLTPQLLRRLYTAAMLCPGFTVTMKDDIAYLVSLSENEQRGFNQPRFADCWRHAHTLAPKPDIPLDVLEWYIAIIREETTRFVNSLGLNDRTRILQRASRTDGYWGHFWLELSLPAGPAFDNLSLAAVASVEFAALERIFARAFPQGQ